jgi:hypothetical protein
MESKTMGNYKTMQERDAGWGSRRRSKKQAKQERREVREQIRNATTKTKG